MCDLSIITGLLGGRAIHIFVFLLWVGVVLVFLWLAACVAGRIGANVWAWIDDTQPRKDNPVISWVAKMVGYRVGYRYNSDSTDEFDYVKDTPTGVKESDWSPFFYVPMISVFFLPYLIYLYEVLIFAGIVVAGAFMIRMHRRLKKLLVGHIADKDAHKRARYSDTQG